MLNAFGVTHVIIGHSERRQYFNETDDSVNRKLEFALEGGLTPDRLRRRGVGRARSRTDRRRTAPPVHAGIQRDFGQEGGKADCIAYEPVWAIGTGKTATPQMAADAHAVIRHEAAKAFGDDFAAALAHTVWRQRKAG